MADPEKKRGRGNPSKKKEGPKFDPRRDLPNPAKPKCGAKYKDSHGIWRVCGKRGYHFKHGPGNG